MMVYYSLLLVQPAQVIPGKTLGTKNTGDRRIKFTFQAQFLSMLINICSGCSSNNSWAQNIDGLGIKCRRLLRHATALCAIAQREFFQPACLFELFKSCLHQLSILICHFNVPIILSISSLNAFCLTLVGPRHTNYG